MAPQMDSSQPAYPLASLTPFQTSHGAYPQNPPMHSGASTPFSPTGAVALQANQTAMQTNQLIQQAQVNAMLVQQLNNERQRLLLQTQAMRNAQLNSGAQWSFMQQPFAAFPAASLTAFGMQPAMAPTSNHEASQLLSSLAASQSQTELQSNQLVQQASLYAVLEQQRHDQNGRLQIMQNQPFLSNGPVVSMLHISNINSQLQPQPTTPANPSHTGNTTTTGKLIPFPYSDQSDTRQVTESGPSASASPSSATSSNGVEDDDRKPKAKSRSDNPEASSQ